MRVSKLRIAYVVASCLVLLPALATAEIVSWVYFNGRTYWVDIQTDGPVAGVWFRVRPFSGIYSLGDILVMRVGVRTTSLQSARQPNYCHVWKMYEDAKTLAGCASTVGSAACIVATPASGGSAALVCTAVLSYTANKGLADCLLGVGGLIAEHLGQKQAFRAAAITAGASTGQLIGATEEAIGLACDDVLSN